jgi:Holliday junction resolvase RusA-like endonuclease
VPLTDWRLSIGQQVCAQIILGEPVPKGRPRVNHKTGNVYTPKITVQAEKRVRERLQRVRPVRPVDFPLVLWLTFWCSSSRLADADNLAKLVADAGQGVIWENDRLIVEWHLRTFARATQPRTEVVATCLP